MPRRLAPLLCLLIALPGCLGEGGPGESLTVRGDTATVYLSLPREGVLAPVGRAVDAGARLALADAGGRAGGMNIRVRRLDSSEPGGAAWSPELVQANAERASGDRSAIAYLGELDFGASAISLPVTNADHLLQVGPVDGLTSLTDIPPGRPRSAPERLRPSGERNFVRLTPSDLIEVEGLVDLIRDRGTERPALIFDKEVYGRELAAQLISRARRDGPELVSEEEYRGDVRDIPGLVAKVSEKRPDAVVLAGVAGGGTGRLLAAIDAAMPGVPTYATSGILARDPRRPVPAAPISLEALSPVRPEGELPASGRRLLRRLRMTSQVMPEAVYGYEAMRVILEAVRRGGRDRRAVTRSALGLRDRRAPFGRYRLRGTGEVDGERLALYALQDGRFRFVRMQE